MQRRQLIGQAAGAFAALACTGLSALAQSYPSKPITMVVPFPPGGVADTVGRPVAEAMSRHLKQSIVVENKGGAGGGIGMAQVAKSRPDGYTVLMSLSSLVVLPEADKILQRPPMFQVNQLKPIARFTADPTVLVVRADSPWKTYAEFMTHVKANPGRISFGSSGNYGTMHVPMEQLKAATSSFMLHVPYTGAGPAVLALLAARSRPCPPARPVSSSTSQLAVCAHWPIGVTDACPPCPRCPASGSLACRSSIRSGPACSCPQARPRTWWTPCAKRPNSRHRMPAPWLPWRRRAPRSCSRMRPSSNVLC